MLFFYFDKYKSIFTLTIILLFSYLNLFWQSNVFAKSLVGFSQVLDSITLVFHNISKDASGVFKSYKDYNELKQENQILKKKLDDTTKLQLELETLRSTNIKLKEILELSTEVPAFNIETLKAEIISHEPDNWFRRIIINKGSQHGIKPYMPVVAYSFKKNQVYYAVIGKTIQVSKNTTRILSITDQYFKLGVLLEKTGHWGLLKGQRPHKKDLFVQYLPISIQINPGDRIVTSGANGIFMPYMPVGIVKEKELHFTGYQAVTVEPLIDISKLKFVEIILKDYNKELLELQTKKIDNIEGYNE